MDKEYKDKYGHKLVADEQGLLTDLYTDQKYILGKDGKVHELKSPLDASPIYLNENGEYVSDYSDNRFTVDENGNVSALDESGNVIATYGDGELEMVEESYTRITEMEENGTIDYFLEFRKYIRNFLDDNYPLSEEDLRSIDKGSPTENAINRQETSRILNEAMDEILKEIAEENIQMSNEATPSANQNFQQIFSEKQQEMLEILWKKQHQEDQEISETSEGENELPDGEELQLETEIQEEQTAPVSEPNEQEEQDLSNNEEIANDDSQDTTIIEDNTHPQEETIDSGVAMEANATQQGGQQMIDGIVKQSKVIGVRTEEINNVNREIKQVEIDYMQDQQKQSDIDIEVSVGE